MKVLLFCICVLLSSSTLVAQTAPGPDLFKKDYEAKKMIQFLPSFDLLFPTQDLTKRFGTISAIGLGVGYKTNRNVTFNGFYRILFGNRVKEVNMLDNLKGSSGELIDANGNYASISYAMRGGNVGLKLGKIIRIEKNANNGIWLQGGFSYLQHRIKIEYQADVLPQLDNDMSKGYDRLSGGVGFLGSIGYHHITANNTISYFFNFDFGFNQAQSLRTYNYDTRSKDQGKRKDYFNGLSFGIILPVNAQTADEESLFK